MLSSYSAFATLCIPTDAHRLHAIKPRNAALSRASGAHRMYFSILRGPMILILAVCIVFLESQTGTAEEAHTGAACKDTGQSGNSGCSFPTAASMPAFRAPSRNRPIHPTHGGIAC